MGKKCAQAVQTVRRKMCTSASYAHVVLLDIMELCTNSVHPLFFPATVHNTYSTYSTFKNVGLYTVSTEPTITTICLKNNKTVKTDKRSLV
jgi:hypothetical protein